MLLQITEENFIKEMKKGNEKALEYVVNNYGWILKTVLKKHLFYLQDYYNECINDCFLAIWENINSYNPNKSSFKNWAGGIAKNTYFTLLKKQKKTISGIDTNYPDIGTDLENNFLDKESARQLHILIHNLREPYKEVFTLRTFGELPFSQIGDLFEKTDSWARVVFYRAKKQLKEEMK